jgi:hypothetical protein
VKKSVLAHLAAVRSLRDPSIGVGATLRVVSEICGCPAPGLSGGLEAGENYCAGRRSQKPDVRSWKLEVRTRTLGELGGSIRVRWTAETAEDFDRGLFVYRFVGVAAARGEDAGRAALVAAALDHEVAGDASQPVEFRVEFL